MAEKIELLPHTFIYHSRNLPNELQGSFEIHLDVNPLFDQRSYTIVRIWHVETGSDISLNQFSTRAQNEIAQLCLKWARFVCQEWRQAREDQIAKKRLTTLKSKKDE